jgi:hypothetical protein
LNCVEDLNVLEVVGVVMMFLILIFERRMASYIIEGKPTEEW